MFEAGRRAARNNYDVLLPLICAFKINSRWMPRWTPPYPRGKLQSLFILAISTLGNQWSPHLCLCLFPSPCPSTDLSHGLIQALDNIVVNHWPRTSLWTGPVIETINSDRTVYFDRLQRWRIGLDVTEFGKNLRCKFYCYLGRGESKMNEFLLIIFFSKDFSDCSMLLDFKLNIIITW